MRGPLQAHQAVALAMGADGSSTVYKSTVQPGRLAPPIAAGEVGQFRVPAAASPSLSACSVAVVIIMWPAKSQRRPPYRFPSGAETAAASSQAATVALAQIRRHRKL